MCMHICICVNDKCGNPYSITTHHCQVCVEDPVGAWSLIITANGTRSHYLL